MVRPWICVRDECTGAPPHRITAIPLTPVFSSLPGDELPTLAAFSSSASAGGLWLAREWRGSAGRRLVLYHGPRPPARSSHSLKSPGIHPGGFFGGHGYAYGYVARLLIDKGFGFIRDETGIEHFFHRSSVRGPMFELLREGQRVEFQIEDSAKGTRAGDVRLIEG